MNEIIGPIYYTLANDTDAATQGKLILYCWLWLCDE